MNAPAAGFAFGLVIVAFSGCLDQDQPVLDVPSPRGIVSESTTFVHNALGQLLGTEALGPAYNLTARLYAVGQPGAEPSIGVTSNGNVFFQAFEKTMKSVDHGQTWRQVRGLLTATSTSDPYLWVDPDTDRVFQLNMGAPFGGRGPWPTGADVPASVGFGLLCSHLAWTDDYGANWGANPLACGVPMNDHEKLATGPWVGDLDALAENPTYPNAVYYAYNKVLTTFVSQRVVKEPETPDLPVRTSPGGWIAVSFDGGQTFPFSTRMFTAGCYGSLHGAITAGPDGTVYVPARYCPGPLVASSRDNGRTWSNVVVGESAGVPEWQKNPEIAVDADNNVYLTWVGKDNRLYLSISRDHAATWTEPLLVSPPAVGSAVWPTAAAGSPGRVGFAYVATEESTEAAWNVTNETRWNLYYTYSLNALDEEPTFVTLKVTEEADPVQRGPVCINSGECVDGNRNLLDFIDLSLDRDGRPYVAYADGCTTPQCLRPEATHMDSRSRDAMTMVLLEGPSLLEERGLLAPFAASE